MAETPQGWFGTSRINLNFPINWFLFIVASAGMLIILYAVSPDTKRPLYVFIASILGGASALLAFVNAMELRAEQLRQADVHQKHLKAQAALDFMHRWNDPQFFHARKNAGPALTTLQKLPAEKQREFLSGDDGRFANIIDVLNVFEILSLSIQRELVDEETARQFFRSIVVGYWQNGGKSFVEIRRADRQNNRLFKDFDWLFNKWKDL